MASDSDLEAYLNQLSKKTHSLKQDVNTHGYASSRPTSAGDKSSDASDEDDSVKRDSINTIGQGVFTSDITALSEKYGRPRHKKSQPYDEFSNLEKKYLKKATKKNASRRDSPEVVGQEIYHTSAKISDNEPRRHSRMTKAAHTKQNDTSCDSSVDDELARYLNESSLIDSHKEETEYRDVHIKSKSSSDGSEAGSDDVINFDNIMTVDDIMGQLSEEIEDDGSDHTQRKQSSSSNIFENNHHADIQNDRNASSLSQKEMSDRKASASKNKSLFELEKGDSGGNTENIKNLLMKSSEGLFYPSTEVGVKNGNNDKMEGVLFTEVPDNIFHSSRRSSLMSPIFRRKSSTKSLLSVSFPDFPDKNDSEDLTERSVAESVVENISSSHVSSVSEAITEKESSENVIAEYSEEFDATDDGKSSEKAVVKPKKNLMALPKTDVRNKEIISRKLSTDARRSSADQSSPGISYRSKDLKSEEPESSLKASDKNDDNMLSRNVLDKEEKVHRKAREKTKKSDAHFHRKSRKKSKKKPRHRSTSSSSSSTSSSSSSSSSSRYSEKYRDAYRRHTRKKHKSKKHFFNPWMNSPYMYPWWMSQMQQQSSPAAAENSFHLPDPRLMGGWIPSSSVVGVEDIMRQQVALTRQFMESQQALYHAYTSTLTSSYHYTSLKDTEKYIKKKKPPLTFDEAYRLVQEEMKDSKKEKKKSM